MLYSNFVKLEPCLWIYQPQKNLCFYAGFSAFLLFTLGRSVLLSRAIAERVSTAVTPGIQEYMYMLSNILQKIQIISASQVQMFYVYENEFGSKPHLLIKEKLS